MMMIPRNNTVILAVLNFTKNLTIVFKVVILQV